MKKQTSSEQEDISKQLDTYFQKFFVVKSESRRLYDAFWCSEINLFRIEAVHQFFSEQKVGFQVKTQWYLYPEEALYLFYKGKAKFLRNLEIQTIEKQEFNYFNSGMDLMRFVYEEKKRDIYSQMFVWKCYNFLRKNGFHLKRYSQALDIDELKDGNEEIVKKTKLEKETSPKGALFLQPIFKVYETNQSYFQDHVSFYLIIISVKENLLETDFLDILQKNFKEVDRLQMALVDEEVIIYNLKTLKNNSIDLIKKKM